MPFPFAPSPPLSLRLSDKKRRNLTRDDDNAAKQSNGEEEEEEEEEEANQSVTQSPLGRLLRSRRRRRHVPYHRFTPTGLRTR